MEGWGIHVLWITSPRMTGDPITKSIIDCNRKRSGRSRTLERDCEWRMVNQGEWHCGIKLSNPRRESEH